MAEYGLPPSAFTYVGDNPAKDFTAPSAMGWRTVQITRPGGVHNAVGPGVPDLVISSLDELPAEWPCGTMEATTQRTAAGAPLTLRVAVIIAAVGAGERERGKTLLAEQRVPNGGEV